MMIVIVLRDAGAERQACRAKKAARADPGTDERSDQHIDRHAAAGNHEIVRGFDGTALIDGDADQNQYIAYDNDCVSHF